MKRNLFASGLLAVLTGLASDQASLAQNLPPSYRVNPVSPSDVSAAATAIKSKIEAWGYGNVENLSRDRSGVWHAQVMRNKVEIAVSVDKGGRITAQPGNGQLAPPLQPAVRHRQPVCLGARRRGLPGPQRGCDRRRPRLSERPLRRRHQGIGENPQSSTNLVPAGVIR